MSAEGKGKRHTPSQVITVKKTSALHVPKKTMPPILEETLESLRLKYSVPLAGVVDNASPQFLQIWQLVCGIKGFLTKRKVNKDVCGMHLPMWADLKQILDRAIEDDQPEVFDFFAKAWGSADIRNSSRSKTGQTEKSASEHSRDLGLLIETLLPNLPANPPNSPIAVQVLDIIEDLQRNLNRAPTNSEIVNRSAKHKVGGYTKAEVSRQILKMGLKPLMSLH